jgi:hypothetical protein
MNTTISGNYYRNYPALFLALDDVLEALGEGRPDEEALQRSFEVAADLSRELRTHDGAGQGKQDGGHGLGV